MHRQSPAVHLRGHLVMNREQAEKLRMDGRHWKLGSIYYCKSDPRVIVRNRWQVGWSWNFGHSLVWLVLAVCIGLFLLPALVIGPMISASIAQMIAMYLMMIIILLGFAYYIANGPR